jgi:MFS family permease
MGAKPSHLALSVPGWLLVLGAVWSLVSVYLLGSAGDKLGRVGTLQVTLFSLALFSIGSIPGLLAIVWACGARLAGWTQLRLQLLAVTVAVATLILMSACDIVSKVSDYLVQLGSVQRQLYILIVYALVGAMVPCAVTLTLFSIVQVAGRSRSHVDV